MSFGKYADTHVKINLEQFFDSIRTYPGLGEAYMLQLTNQLIALGYASPGWSYAVGEHHIYGSSRLGIHQTKKELRNRYKQEEIFIPSNLVNTTALYRGKRNYELSNHLGNVNMVISDKRKSVCDEELGVEYFVAEVLSAVDYYPFGMMMPDRQWYAGNDSSSYRFGFNGQLRDDDIFGTGNSVNFRFRVHDPRLGRFLSVDPLAAEYSWNSTYAFAENDVIRAIDLEGLEKFIITRTYDASGVLISNHARLISATASNASGANGGVLVRYVNIIQTPPPNPPITRQTPFDANQTDNRIVWYTGFLHPTDQANANQLLNNFNNDRDGNGATEVGRSYNLAPLSSVVNGPFMADSPNLEPTTATGTVNAINNAGLNALSMGNLNVNFQITSIFPTGSPSSVVNSLNAQRQNTIMATLNASLGAGNVNNLIASGQISFSTINDPGAGNPSLTIQQGVSVPATETHNKTIEDENEGPNLRGQ